MPRTAENVIVIPRLNGRAAHPALGGKSEKSRRLTILAGAVFLLFMLLGALCIVFSDTPLTQYLAYLSKTQVAQRLGYGMAAAMLSAALPQLIVLVLCCIFANSALGLPFLAAILMVRGFLSGAMNASLVAAAGWKGLPAALAAGAQPSALSALGVILLVSDGMRTSAAIHAVVLKGRSRNLRTACDALYHALAVSLLLTVASAVIEGLLYKLLGSFLGS